MTCHARKKNTGIEAHPAHVFPTAERLRRQCPLPSRGDGLFSEQGHGIVVGVSCTKLLPPNPSWRSGGAHELGGAPAEKLNGMIIIRMSESSYKLIFLASLFSAYLRRRYSLILSLFFSKYSCFCTHTIEGLPCFHCLAYSLILSLFSS